MVDGTFLYLLFPNKEVEGCCVGHNNRAALYSPTEFVTPPPSETSCEEAKPEILAIKTRNKTRALKR